VDAVKQWRFEPGTKEGKPVAVKISVEIRFHDL
jgi:outer membrane biosynthesis protein TonB